MTLGQNIKMLREERGMTQQKLARKAGISQISITSWETDKYEPSLFSAILLADAFKITLDELVGRTVAK